MSEPFSVAMSVYYKDNPLYFDRALQSITEQQSVLPNEIVLVCDGVLNDELEKVIEKYQIRYPIFKVVKLSENKGLGNALRIAVTNASYEIIARMDSDDISLPNRFEEELSLFNEDSELDIAGGDIFEFIENEDNIVAKRVVPCSNEDILRYMKKRCPFNHVSVMYKKSAVLRCGNYQDLFWNEDYYLWIRMAEQNCKMKNTGTVLVNVRTGKDMYMRRGGMKYFKSELFLQKYLLKNKMINAGTFVSNIVKRFIIQLLLPASVRGWVFRTFARRSVQ